MGFKYIFSASFGSGHRGVAVLISNKITYDHLAEIKDREGRYIMIRGRVEGTLVTILNVYAPPGSKCSFFKSLIDLIASESQGIFICGGDFNVLLDPKLDASNTSTQLASPLRKQINTMIKEIGLIDVWRDFHPGERDYTYYSHPHTSYSRIDYFLAFGKDKFRFKNFNIGLIDTSDHALISLYLNLENKPKNTLWRLNSGILNNRATREQLVVEIEQYVEQNDNGLVPPTILWDACKVVLRGQIIAITSKLKKCRLEKLNTLTNSLNKLELENKKGPNKNLSQEIKKIKTELDYLYTQEIEKKLMFLKQKYYESGGKAMKLLARKLCKQQADATIQKIQDPISKQLFHKSEDIQRVFENYY